MFCQISVTDPDPGSGAFMTTGSEIRDGKIWIREKNPGSATLHHNCRSCPVLSSSAGQNADQERSSSLYLSFSRLDPPSRRVKWAIILMDYLVI
jgi:hypothetical protein